MVEKKHFQVSSKCKHHSIHAVGEDYSTDSSENSGETICGITTDQDHFVNAINPGNQLIFCEMEVNKKPVKLQIDCALLYVFFLSAMLEMPTFAMKW